MSGCGSAPFAKVHYFSVLAYTYDRAIAEEFKLSESVVADFGFAVVGFYVLKHRGEFIFSHGDFSFQLIRLAK